jgi:hypothetical protein
MGSWKIIAMSLPVILRRSAGGDVEQIAAIKIDLIGGDLRRPGQKAHDGEHGHGLAGAGFTDNGQNLSRIHIHGNIVHGAEKAAGGLEFNGQILDVKQGHGRFTHFSC